MGHMGLFFYTKKGSIISTVDLPTTEIIEPIQLIQTILHFFNLFQISRNPLPTFYIFDKKPGFLETRLMYINHVR